MSAPFPRVALRRVARVLNGGTPSADATNWNGSLPWATPEDLGQPGRHVSATRRTLTEDGLRNGSTLAPAGSVLVSTRAPIGYVKINDVPMAFNQGCRALIPTGDERFLAYVLEGLRRDLEALGQGSTFTEVSTAALAGWHIPSPDPATQRAVADALDRELVHFTDLVRERTAQRALLLERRAAVVQAAVTGEGDATAEANVGWVDRLPAHWSASKLTRVARLGSGHTPSRARPDWWMGCSIPWITTGEVQQVRDDRREVISDTRECISELGLANSAAELHPRGTVVLCRTAASAGYSGVMGLDMATSQDFATWTCGPRLDPFYLLYCLRAMRPYLLGYLAQGSTHRTIYMPDIEALHIPLPPIDEQHVIVGQIREQVRVIDELVDTVDKQLRLLSERRQALIAAAVTGQLDLTGVAA